MTHGTIAGTLLSALIRGCDHPWAKLYDPSRLPVAAAAAFLEQTANVVARYADWVTPGERGSSDEVRPAEGAVIRRGAH